MKRLLLACLLLTSPSFGAEPLTLPKLLGAFRQVKGLQTHFREEKHLTLLAAPLVSEGEIYFEPTDRLLRETVKPSGSRMIINDGTLSFRDAHSAQTMDLNQTPIARLFVDGFIKILAGNDDALRQLYDMKFTPQGTDGWTLHLTPRVKPMSEVFAAIDLVGHGVVIEQLRMLEIGGDESITTFSATNTTRAFTSDERTRLFQP